VLLGIIIVGAALWSLWIWGARLLRAKPEWRRSVTGVLLGVTLGAGIPLLVAVAYLLVTFVAASNANASHEATFLAQGIARGLNALTMSAVVTAAGAVVFGVMEIRRRRGR